MKVCKIDWCDRLVTRRKDLCNAHYKRKRIGGDMDKPFREENIDKPCKVEGCINTARTSLLCKTHYQAWYREERKTNGARRVKKPLTHPSTVDPAIDDFLYRRF